MTLAAKIVGLIIASGVTFRKANDALTAAQELLKIREYRDRQLMAIAEDGYIDSAERVLFDEIANRDLADSIEAAMEVQCARIAAE